MKNTKDYFDKTSLREVVNDLVCDKTGAYLILSAAIYDKKVYDKHLMSFSKCDATVNKENIEFLYSYMHDSEELKGQGQAYYRIKLATNDSDSLQLIPPKHDRGPFSYNYSYLSSNSGHYFYNSYSSPTIIQLKNKEYSKLTVLDDVFAKDDQNVYWMGKRIAGAKASELEEYFYKSDAGATIFRYKDNKFYYENEHANRCLKTLVDNITSQK